jgi:hypothetical protein
VSDSLYDQFRELLTGEVLSPEEKEILSRKILAIIFREEA